MARMITTAIDFCNPQPYDSQLIANSPRFRHDFAMTYATRNAKWRILQAGFLGPKILKAESHVPPNHQSGVPSSTILMPADSIVLRAAGDTRPAVTSTVVTFGLDDRYSPTLSTTSRVLVT